MEKLKQKVASSSSRVIASLQHAAAGNFQQQQQHSTAASGLEESTSSQAIQQQQQQQISDNPQAVSVATVAAPSSSVRLMAADATAHLTENERKILLEVFKKEEQFQRDTIKQMSAGSRIGSHNYGETETENNNNNMELPTLRKPRSGAEAHLSRSLHQYRSVTPAGSSAATGSLKPRAASSCSMGQQQQQQELATSSVGQCRICRKLILANETCHLCSACHQFVCEDCGSYSTNNQHWTCSSCRRRATKPNIPANTLKELGLNHQDQHPNARRMTLRLEQAELERATGKGSAESNSSSHTSSSGGSAAHNSQTADNCLAKHHQKPPAAAAASHRSAASHQQEEARSQQQQQQQTQVRRPSSSPTAAGQSFQAQKAHCDTSPGLASGQSRFNQASPAAGEQQQQQRMRLEARKSLSQPTGQRMPQSQPEPPTPSSEHLVHSRAGPQLPEASLARLADHQTNAHQFGLLQPNEQLARRASAVSAGERARQASARAGSGRSVGQRKQSAAAAYYAMPTPAQAAPSAGPQFQPHLHQANYQPTLLAGHNQQGQYAMPDPPDWHLANSTMMQQQQQQQQQPQYAPTNPINRRSSNTSGPPNALGFSLIPTPPDPFQLRRLSDQTNLVRRSSIMDDTLNALSMARNRSHSNIDTVSSCTNYLYHRPMTRAELIQQSLLEQQRQQQTLANNTSNYLEPQESPFARQHQTFSHDYAQQYSNDAQWNYGQQQQHLVNHQDQEQYYMNSSQQQLTSIITPYAQKQRRSSEDVRSDSSSDIEDDARVLQSGLDFDNDQPSEYFAPPRPLSVAQAGNNQQQQLMVAAAARMEPQVAAPAMAIPSVSVSEFSSGQRQANQQQAATSQAFQQQPANYEIMTTPMQINSAIEQVIRKQEERQLQQQQQQMQYRSPNAELLTGDEYLMPRRGSGSRTLPKIPGEQQSRSLLELGNQNVAGPADQQLSTLDLPSSQPGIRRASAPEGQNIKIVVDDIDGCMIRGSAGAGYASAKHQHQTRLMYGAKAGGGGGGGELYERLVLYRDDSIDPNTNMSRGFGLHVMGGKIDADNKLQACISWVLPGGPADKVGLKANDKIIEWDGKCLVNMSYEQTADVIESSANIAELLVKPWRSIDAWQAGANYIRSQRRLSHQTENDLRRQQPAMSHQSNGGHFPENGIRRHDSGHKNRDSHTSNNYQHQNDTNGGQVARAGTGRKLPQIPRGVQATGSNGYSSRAQLDSSGKFMPSPLSYQQQQEEQQQSLSTNELYTGGRTGSITEASQQRFLSTAAYANGDPYRASSVVNIQYEASQAAGRTSSNQRYANLSAQNEVCGLIGLQVSVDEHMNQLEISVLSAVNIERDPSLDYCVRVKILPESNRFKPCTTQPSCDLNWKETFIFQNFPTQQIHRMALEIGIWVYEEAPRLSTHIAQPICETLISIQSARERNTDFWPLMPPPTSPQARRKSLNDLIGSRQEAVYPLDRHYETSLNASHSQARRKSSKPSDQYIGHSPTAARLKVQAYDSVRYPSEVINKQRSSSARNLPTDSDVSRLGQPRRASDEVAGSSSHRLSTRTSPTASRRSISVMNVDDGHSLLTRPSSRLGSQSSILRSRRDSSKQHSCGGSPSSGRYASPNGSSMRINEQVGVTPNGRRSSLVGIQSMRGYRSQKNSNSGSTTDQESPLRAMAVGRRVQEVPTGAAQLAKPNGQDVAKQQATSRPSLQHGGSITTSSHSNSPAPSANCSRRGSSEQQHQLQRKGSFARKTLQKLKRTISLSRGADDQQDCASSSRRSSMSSDNGEDIGIPRRLAEHSGSVGRLKLSFVLTKGQLEVDVICAQGLKIDLESAIGIYVKMYLKGKGNKSNKRKTRSVNSNEALIFRQVIKYDGSLIDNKTLEVSVWLKQGGLRGKIPIGYTEIQLFELKLEQVQTSWYNLHAMDVICSSSMDE